MTAIFTSTPPKKGSSFNIGKKRFQVRKVFIEKGGAIPEVGDKILDPDGKLDGFVKSVTDKGWKVEVRYK